MLKFPVSLHTVVLSLGVMLSIAVGKQQWAAILSFWWHGVAARSAKTTLKREHSGMGDNRQASVTNL
jgi:hypothetical protein